VFRAGPARCLGQRAHSLLAAVEDDDDGVIQGDDENRAFRAVFVGVVARSSARWRALVVTVAGFVVPRHQLAVLQQCTPRPRPQLERPRRERRRRPIAPTASPPRIPDYTSRNPALTPTRRPAPLDHPAHAPRPTPPAGEPGPTARHPGELTDADAIRAQSAHPLPARPVMRGTDHLVRVPPAAREPRACELIAWARRPSPSPSTRPAAGNPNGFGSGRCPSPDGSPAPHGARSCTCPATPRADLLLQAITTLRALTAPG
jgi:hypothetical protein